MASPEAGRDPEPPTLERTAPRRGWVDGNPKREVYGNTFPHLVGPTRPSSRICELRRLNAVQLIPWLCRSGCSAGPSDRRSSHGVLPLAPPASPCRKSPGEQGGRGAGNRG